MGLSFTCRLPLGPASLECSATRVAHQYRDARATVARALSSQSPTIAWSTSAGGMSPSLLDVQAGKDWSSGQSHCVRPGLALLRDGGGGGSGNMKRRHTVRSSRVLPACIHPQSRCASGGHLDPFPVVDCSVVSLRRSPRAFGPPTA